MVRQKCKNKRKKHAFGRLWDGSYILIQTQLDVNYFIGLAILYCFKGRTHVFMASFFSENEGISAPPPCGLLIGVYRFYENWSTETFRKE
jgi:hypothetical protein